MTQALRKRDETGGDGFSGASTMTNLSNNQTRARRSTASGAVLLAAALVCAVAGHALGQNAPATAPSTQPEAPAGITKQDGKFIINFKNASVDTVLDELSRTAGFSIVKVNPTNNERISSIVNLTGVSTNEAITLINVALNELGYAAVVKGNVLQIHRRSEAMTVEICQRQPTPAGPSAADRSGGDIHIQLLEQCTDHHGRDVEHSPDRGDREGAGFERGRCFVGEGDSAAICQRVGCGEAH
jgi:hypothetical protein